MCDVVDTVVDRNIFSGVTGIVLCPAPTFKGGSIDLVVTFEHSQQLALDGCDSIPDSPSTSLFCV